MTETAIIPRMAVLAVRHTTTYRYRQPVSFGEHRVMLRPRDDGDQRVLEAALDIAPAPSQLVWTRDWFGNHVAIARFAETAAELRFESSMRVEPAATEFAADAIAPPAGRYPFAYSKDERSALHRYLAPPREREVLAAWAHRFLDAGGGADTRALLLALNSAIDRDFGHMTRHEKGTQNAAQTLSLGSGSCRDLAMLMIGVLRTLGLAARFASGYLDFAAEHQVRGTGGNTHAWVQAYLPGPGWVDFDPSRGSVGNRSLVRVAVAPEPHAAIPLQGSWIGRSSDHIAMEVAVEVVAA
jgi:transglutaminase-like putative cysteine protease